MSNNFIVKIEQQNNIDSTIETQQQRKVSSVGVQGPAGIPGTVGATGVQGPSGGNFIGGYPVIMSGLQTRDVVMFGTNQWNNVSQTEISDGGNY